MPPHIRVSVPYEITLLSNTLQDGHVEASVSVPYEITLLSNECENKENATRFQYLMKLHYSQTSRDSQADSGGVSVPYEITLLSNNHLSANIGK